MMTPNQNSQHDLFRSPGGHSPRSNILDSTHSFNNGTFAGSSKRGGSLFQHSNNESERGSARHIEREFKLGKPVNKALLENERQIVNEFSLMLKHKEMQGKLRFSADNHLNKQISTSSNPIFRYDSISFQDELSGMAPLSKRIEKEVSLEYDRPIDRPVKLLKTKLGFTQDYNYSNVDLVFSSWYDSMLASIRGEDNPEKRKMLMIDLNDKRVFYSKLMSLIHQKPSSDDL